jgi:hypothetical protein
MWRRFVVGAFVSMLVAACASATSSSPREPLPRNPSILLKSEWADQNVSTALEAIEHLRPQFFNRRGETSLQLRNATTLTVYMDNMRLGGIETLRNVPITAIQSIRYLSSGEATYRWGTNHMGGVIQLLSR